MDSVLLMLSSAEMNISEPMAAEPVMPNRSPRGMLGLLPKSWSFLAIFFTRGILATAMNSLRNCSTVSDA